jgi:prepilin signal peptidase PulO-like enzyme (type II secretory pathway)
LFIHHILSILVVFSLLFHSNWLEINSQNNYILSIISPKSPSNSLSILIMIIYVDITHSSLRN